jgi:hypothetical protein
MTVGVEPPVCERCGKVRAMLVEVVFHRERRIALPCGCWAADNPEQVNPGADRVRVVMRASGCPRYVLLPEVEPQVERVVRLLKKGPAILTGGAWSGKTTVAAAVLHAVVTEREGSAAWVTWDALISSDTDTRQVQDWAGATHLVLDDAGGQAVFTPKQIDWCSNRLEALLRGRRGDWTTLIVDASGGDMQSRLNAAAWERLEAMTNGRRCRLTGYYKGVR